MSQTDTVNAKTVLTDSDDTLGKPVRISCQGAATIELDELTAFQGNLKKLSEESYQRLRRSILELGFSFPVHAWKFRNKTYILDAHQRTTTLRRMRDEEGFQIPPLPVVWIEAATKQEASRKLLAATSQYGEVTPQGLFEYMKEFELDLDSMVGTFQFPEIDFERFDAAFFPEIKTVSFDVKEKEPGAMDEEETGMDHDCPKCGYSWND